MKLPLPAWDTAKRVGALLAVILVGGVVLVAGAALINLLLPRTDPTPIVTARKDERKANDISKAIGTAVATETRDSTVHVDITTKEIRNAFEATPPAAPASAAGGVPDLPAAPVDRVRERINEGIARANRAAGAADDSG